MKVKFRKLCESAVTPDKGSAHAAGFDLTITSTQEIERDLNASINLEKLFTVSSTGNYALGDGSSVDLVTNQPSPSLKKESNRIFIYN